MDFLYKKRSVLRTPVHYYYYGDLSFVPASTLELTREDTKVEKDFSSTTVNWPKE
jgi:hypothetical protein